MAWPLRRTTTKRFRTRNPASADPELQRARPITNALGMPMPRSGNFADVYEFNCPATKSKWAIKCFTRQVAGLRERYSEISQATCRDPAAVHRRVPVPGQGIRIRGEWYPDPQDANGSRACCSTSSCATISTSRRCSSSCGQIWARMAQAAARGEPGPLRLAARQRPAGSRQHRRRRWRSS